MGESLMQRRRVRDEGLRVVNLFQQGRSVWVFSGVTVPAEEAPANYVPAAAVIRRVQALSGIIGRKELVGGPPEMGGRLGGRGGPDWQGRPNAMAFGNGRRDPRLTYNGNASFSLDNSVWDARTFSVTGATINKPVYANGRGSVMFGGPLRIPKLVSASKRILFTFDYQAQRNRTGTISDPVNMPTVLERGGDFSQSTVQGMAVTIYDPATGAPFPGNKIPANRISAAATALLQYFPNPNLPFATRNYQTSWSGRNNSQ